MIKKSQPHSRASSCINSGQQKQGQKSASQQVINILTHIPNPMLVTTFSFLRGQQAHTSYPFTLHMIMSLPWDYSTCKNAFVLTSHMCLGKAEVDGHCKACNSLGNNECLKNIIIRYTNGVSKYMQLVYHGITSLIDIVHWKTLTIDVLHLCCLNNTRKLVGYKGVICWIMFRLCCWLICFVF